MVFFFAKNAFYPKKTFEISLETDIYFGKGYFFLSTTVFGPGQNMVRVKKCMFFWGARNSCMKDSIAE